MERRSNARTAVVRAGTALASGLSLAVVLLWLLSGLNLSLIAAPARWTERSHTDSSQGRSTGQTQQRAEATAEYVVVSEIQIDSRVGEGGASDDWIELYNPTDQDVDLVADGYRVEYWAGDGGRHLAVRLGDANDGAYPGGTTIRARGFYLVVSEGAMDEDLKASADALVTRAFTLGQDCAVGLGTGPMEDGPADEDTVDLVGWGASIMSETATVSNPPAGGSVERKANSGSTPPTMAPGGDDELSGNGYDSEDNSQDFVPRYPAQPQASSSLREPGVMLAAYPAVIVADGVSSSTITATVSYTSGYATDGTVVTFATGLGRMSSAWSTGQEVTGTTASGAATAALTGTQRGTATVVATASGMSGTTDVAFVAGPPDALTVTVDSSAISCGVTTTVRVTVTDGYGNPVKDGTPVTLTTDLGVQLDPSTGTTEGGLFSAVVGGDKVGTGTITATTTGSVSDTVGLTVTAGDRSSVSVEAFPAAIVADGVDSSTITATVKDACGNPLPQVTVVFTTNLGSLGSSAVTRTTGADGAATATLTGTETGLATVNAAADGVSGTAEVALVAGPPDALTVTVDSDVISCGVTTTVRVTVTDGYGNLVADGTPVTLTTDLEVDLDPSTGTTGDGVSIALVRGEKAGSGTITATTTGSVSDTVGLTVTPGDRSSLSVEAFPATIAADGVDSSTITATVKDACGNPVPGTTVVVSTSLGSLGSSVVTRTTDGAGVATATLTGTEAGLATVTAAADGVSGTAEVAFVAGPPDALTVTVDSGVISCVVTTTVWVTVTDGYGNLVADGTPVTLTTDLEVEFDPPAGATEDGVFSAVVRGEKVGNGTVTATTTGSVSDTVGLTVTHGAPYSAALEAHPASIVADGVNSSTITATVKDACGNPVPETTVLFTTSLGSLGGSVATRTTDVDGVATVVLTGTERGVATVAAATDGVSETTVVDILGPILVCRRAGCDYTSIQAAVDAARDGEEIRVAAGTYTGVNARGGLSQLVYVSKTVTIRGGYTTTNWTTSNPLSNPTTLDAEGQGRVLYVAGDPSAGASTKLSEVSGQAISPTIEGLRITGGDALGLGGGPLSGWDGGGGIYVNHASARFSDCHVFSNTADYGAGMYLRHGDPRLSGSVVTGNSAQVGGGGIYVHSGRATLVDNSVADNRAGWGGGVYLFANDRALVRDNTLAGNQARVDGGGLYVKRSSAEITDNAVLSNTAEEECGGWPRDCASRGGGVAVFLGDPRLTKNAMSGNTADYGGGVYLLETQGSLGENAVTNNVARVSGGGLGVEESHTVISANTVSSNTAKYGGGIYVRKSSDMELRANEVCDNSAVHYGGGLYLDGSDAIIEENAVRDNFAGRNGGGAYLYDSAPALRGNLFSSNSAPYGGGGLQLQDSDAALVNTVLVDNRAEMSGSGLTVLSGSPRLVHTTLAHNNAITVTAAADGDGSGIDVAGGGVAMTNTIVAGHTVGVYVRPGATARLEATLWGTGAWANGTEWAGPGGIITGTPAYNYWGDPGFASHHVGDYHISRTSLARDRGVDAGVSSDMDGDPRPVGTGFDLGADEWAEPDLSHSVKTASAEEAEAGEVLTFTMVLRNTGFPTSTHTTLLDRIPTHTSYNAGSAKASSGVLTEVGTITGSLIYQGGIAWTGSIAPGEAVTVTLPVLVSERAFIENTAIVSDTEGVTTTLTAQVNVWRVYVPLVLR